MRSEKEILKELIAWLETDEEEINDYARGWIAALKWVLEIGGEEMKTIGTCETCKYFEPWEGKEGFGWCHCSLFVYAPDEIEGDTRCLYYWDFEEYKAGFCVGKDFGCIHYEPKER